MTIYNHFSRIITIFHGRLAPEEGTIAGYAAIIHAFSLSVPMPYHLMLISQKNKKYEQDGHEICIGDQPGGIVIIGYETAVVGVIPHFWALRFILPIGFLSRDEIKLESFSYMMTGLLFLMMDMAPSL